jgi:hypothetical protein
VLVDIIGGGRPLFLSLVVLFLALLFPAAFLSLLFPSQEPGGHSCHQVLLQVQIVGVAHVVAAAAAAAVDGHSGRLPAARIPTAAIVHCEDVVV